MPCRASSSSVVDDGGREVHADDPGEILVRGANVFSGYWPDCDGGPGPDGWLATGDIGFLDHDGDLFLVDRLKELVIVSGFNVYPSEIEDVVSEVDGVGECAVIGVPDERTGEAVVAYVVAVTTVRSRRMRETWPSGSGRTARPGWRGSRCRRGSRSSANCRTPPPARSPRAGCGPRQARKAMGLA